MVEIGVAYVAKTSSVSYMPNFGDNKSSRLFSKAELLNLHFLSCDCVGASLYSGAGDTTFRVLQTPGRRTRTVCSSGMEGSSHVSLYLISGMTMTSVYDGVKKNKVNLK